MAGAWALGAIGFIADAMGIWGFVSDQLPSKPDEGFSQFRVAVGLDGTPGSDGHKLSDAGGTFVSLRTYNDLNNLLGVGSINDAIPSGEFVDAVVGQNGVKQQTTWAEFYAGDDASCVAYITASWYDGQKWGWTGDWGGMCGGLAGYPSGIKVLYLPQCWRPLLL